VRDHRVCERPVLTSATSCRLLHFARDSSSEDIPQHQATTEDAGCALLLQGPANVTPGGRSHPNQQPSASPAGRTGGDWFWGGRGTTETQLMAPLPATETRLQTPNSSWPGFTPTCNACPKARASVLALASALALFFQSFLLLSLHTNNPVRSERTTLRNWWVYIMTCLKQTSVSALQCSGYNQLEVKLFRIGFGEKTIQVISPDFFFFCDILR